jgi:hypothetical protein
MKEIILTEKARAAFLEKFKEKEEGCWEWEGRCDRDGYGELTSAGVAYRAHRVSLLVHHGIQPGPLQVLHTCDNRRCVRPDHLWLGTNADNMRDRTVKLRNGNLKLDWTLVREMRRLWTETSLTMREIGAMFQYPQCGPILRNRMWHDPEYHPPQGKKSGIRPKLIEIYGEKKTLREWADDPRCEVTFETLLTRRKQKMPDSMLLRKRKESGRPRKR